MRLARPAGLLVDGKTLVGQLVAADAEGRLTFRVAAARGARPLRRYRRRSSCRWGQFVESGAGRRKVLLADEGLLVAHSSEFIPGRLDPQV